MLRGSWPRLIELAYWPTMQMIIWGFITQFLATNSSWVAQAFGVLLAGVLLWDVLFRGQIGFSPSRSSRRCGRAIWAICSSARCGRWSIVISLMFMSLIRTLIGVLPAALLAIPLYHYSIFSLGLPLIAFFLNLMMMGWAVGCW